MTPSFRHAAIFAAGILIGMIALSLIQRLDEPRPCPAFKVKQIKTLEVRP